MRWLTWHDLWQFVQSWQGVILSALAVAGGLYYGPRKMLETWDWYWDRFRDRAVLFVLEDRKLMQKYGVVIGGGGPLPMEEFPYYTKEMAGILHRSESSTQRSLQRLRNHGKIEPYQDGWRLKVA